VALRVGEGGGQGRRLRVTAPPPALAKPAAHLRGGPGKGTIAAGVRIAGGGTVSGGWRAGRKGNWLRLA